MLRTNERIAASHLLSTDAHGFGKTCLVIPVGALMSMNDEHCECVAVVAAGKVAVTDHWALAAQGEQVEAYDW